MNERFFYLITFCTIRRTIDARSRGHDILNTDGPGHGITDSSSTTTICTYKSFINTQKS